MILLLDNRDSFVFNVADALGSLGAQVRVVRSDTIGPEEALAMRPSHLVLSPGPGRPEDAGASIETIRVLAGVIPILGICLGHQAIAMAFGGEVARGPKPVHGKASAIWHDGRGLYRGLPNPFDAGRYHSLVVREESLPSDLILASHTSEGVVMGIRHRRWPVEGIQFHPESVLTRRGLAVFRNFLGAGALAAGYGTRCGRDAEAKR